MKKKNVTINDLAVMVGKGFGGVDKRFDGIDKRFDAIDFRLDKIEKLILADHKKRIERLETEVKELKELIAFK